MFTRQAYSTVTEWTGINLGGLVQSIWCSRYLVAHLDFQIRQIIGQDDATILQAVTSFINTAPMSNPQHKQLFVRDARGVSGMTEKRRDTPNNQIRTTARAAHSYPAITRLNDFAPTA